MTGEEEVVRRHLGQTDTAVGLHGDPTESERLLQRIVAVPRRADRRRPALPGRPRPALPGLPRSAAGSGRPGRTTGDPGGAGPRADLDRRQSTRLGLPRPAAALRRGRLVLRGALAAALLAGTVAAGVALTRPATQLQQLACYPTPSVAEGVAAIVPATGDPIAVCAALWREGAVAAGNTVPPELVACVLHGGAVAVLPGRPQGGCAAAGLADLDPSSTASAAALRRFTVAVDRRLAAEEALSPGGRCYRERVLARVLREELARAGLADWRVQPPSGSGRAPACVTFEVSEADRTVILQPATP